MICDACGRKAKEGEDLDQWSVNNHGIARFRRCPECKKKAEENSPAVWAQRKLGLISLRSSG